MARSYRSQRIHDVTSRESWDKIVLGLAFAAGVGGGLALKLSSAHPFIAAAFSAAVLCLYALIAYLSTSLRLEPEVIGDNSYYLGFLFTLTSLAVTLYFVVEAGAEQRAQLIPEVISGFGVALVSTIVGVFIRVLMMQFRLDLVARERETRMEMDEVGRRLRVELSQTLERVKAFTVESLQHSAERESEFRRATDVLVKGTQTALQDTARFLREETVKVFTDQSAAAIDEIRKSIHATSEVSLAQIKTSFSEMAEISEQMRKTHGTAHTTVEQSIAALQLQGASVAEQIGQLSRRLRTIAEETETSGATLSKSISGVAAKLDTTVDDAAKRLGAGFAVFDRAAKDAATRSQAVVNDVAEKLHNSIRHLSSVATNAEKDIERSAKVIGAQLPTAADSGKA